MQCNQKTNLHLISFQCCSKIEKTSTTFTKLPETRPVPLGNCGLISLDPGEDKSTVYQDLLQAYKWVTKVLIAVYFL